MENRDKNLLSMRPSLNLAMPTGSIERFQNNTLRPILKLQNDLILQICHHQFIKRKEVFFQLPKDEKLLYIENQLDRDKQLKHLLFGILIGNFTISEWQFYKEHEQELRKRMTSLLIQRIQSQSSLLSSNLN